MIRGVGLKDVYEAAFSFERELLCNGVDRVGTAIMLSEPFDVIDDAL